MTAALREEQTSLYDTMLALGKASKNAARVMANASAEQKNDALKHTAKALRANVSDILEANAKDMQKAQKNGVKGAFLDRLKLDESRVEGMASGIDAIIKLDDPVGRSLAKWDRPNGLNIERVAVPLGVIGVIYESRPNVTADAGALCLKSGNAAILRGGSESRYSSQAILDCLQKGLEEAGLPKAAIQNVPTTDREAVGILLKMNDYVDVIVPRGGKGLIKRIIDDSSVPTLQHLDGNNHCYVHESADIRKAVDIVTNAKMRRTGVCGATETVVIDAAIAEKVLPLITASLREKNCEIRGDEKAQAIDSHIKPATDDDWDTEYLDAIIAVKIVSNIDEALDFLDHHSSGHTDAIVAEDNAAAERFIKEVDSAIVVQNASTQFADGGEFGMGAEIGIATGRLHARGPVGVEQLTTYKYAVRGNGQTRP